MSRVYFHSQSDNNLRFGAPDSAPELRGSERAHASFVVNQIAIGLLNIDGYEREKKLYDWLPPLHYLRSSQPGLFARSYATAFFVGGDESLIVKDGKSINVWELALNTALAVGNDPVKLFARIHAQCEIHGFIEGPNRKWLAEIMEAGRKSGLYRHDQGWEAVIKGLKTRDTEPMVMSYSVCNGFPNSEVSDWMPPWPEGVEHTWRALTSEQQKEREIRSDEWYELSREEQWSRSLAALRNHHGMLELKPDDWDEYRFGHNLTVWDLFDEQPQPVDSHR
jgi:hypothetical protein